MEQGGRQTGFIVTGDVNLDVIIHGLEKLPDPGEEVFIPEANLCLGGSAADTAVALARLGERVSLHGYVSDDYFGRYLRRLLREFGVDISLLQEASGHKTGLSIGLTSDRERSFISCRGSNAAYRPPVPAAGTWNGFTHLHLCAVNWRDNLVEYGNLLRAARAGGMGTSLDTGWFDGRAMSEKLLDLLPLVDVFFPNESEAGVLTGKKSWEESLDVLVQRVPIAVITRGGRGVAVQKGSERVVLPAFPVSGVDAVGTGDAFAAGFLIAYRGKWDLRRATLWASACGALAATRCGGAQAAPTGDEVRAFLKERAVMDDEGSGSPETGT